MNLYPAESLLNGSITDAATTLTLASAANLIAPFYLVIEDEIIDIETPAVGNTFNNVTRGALGTDRAAHAGGTPAYELYSDSFPFSAIGPAPNWWSSIAAELRTLEARAAAGGATFPQIVAAVDRLNQSASFSVDLVATPNGDYELNDYSIVATDDSGATVTYQLNWTDETGPVVIGPINVSLGTGQPSRFSITGLTLLNSGISLIPELTPPTTIHAVPGTPITAAFIISGATTLQLNFHATVTQNR